MTRLISLLAFSASLTLAACDGADAPGSGNRAASGSGAAVVLVDGSSTVFPISEAFGEEFQSSRGTRVTVGLSGTGGGFKKFCRGETDVTGASRPITQEEIALCRENGVEYIELPVALDALAVIVNPENIFADCMTVAELRTLWEPGAQGRVNSWRQVRGTWPDRPVKLFGPGTDSGTFDYFTTAINGEEGASRGDFAATEDDNVTITGVSGDPDALGYLGIAYVTENAGKVKPLAIRQPDGSCVTPSVEAARNASYQPLSRPLFYYVNKGRAAERAHVREFIAFAFDPATSETLVREVGYVPLPTQAYGLAKAKFDAGRTGTFFGGGSKVGVTLEQLLAEARPESPTTTGG